jgi:hypothetical protein
MRVLRSTVVAHWETFQGNSVFAATKRREAGEGLHFAGWHFTVMCTPENKRGIF